MADAAGLRGGRHTARPCSLAPRGTFEARRQGYSRNLETAAQDNNTYIVCVSRKGSRTLGAYWIREDPLISWLERKPRHLESLQVTVLARIGIWLGLLRAEETRLGMGTHSGQCLSPPRRRMLGRPFHTSKTPMSLYFAVSALIGQPSGLYFGPPSSVPAAFLRRTK